MFDPSSRYASTDTTTHIATDGTEVAHLRRRFVPDPSDREIIGTVTVEEKDRIDLIAARQLGESLAYWRICDDNRAMYPDDLTAQSGRRLDIRMPGAG